jgi:hypothetical protein
VTVELSEQELKLIVAALRQVRHTFALAGRQERKLTDDYAHIAAAYQALHDRLAQLIEPAPGPRRMK